MVGFFGVGGGRREGGFLGTNNNKPLPGFLREVFNLLIKHQHT